MKIFDQMKKSGHEQLIFCLNKPTGLRAIIAIHDTTLGTSVGGTRLMEYEREEDAVIDWCPIATRAAGSGPSPLAISRALARARWWWPCLRPGG